MDEGLGSEVQPPTYTPLASPPSARIEMDGWIAQDGNIDYNRQPQTRANTNNHGEGADGQRVPGTRCRSRPRGDADREARRARDWQATGKAQGQAREDAVGYVGRAGPDRLRAWSSRISSGGVAAGRLCAASAVHPRTARSPHLCSPSNAHAPPPTHAARLQPTLAPEPLPATHSAACPSRAALHHCSPCAAFHAARHCCWLWLWSGGDAARLPSPATPCSNAAALLCSVLRMVGRFGAAFCAALPAAATCWSSATGRPKSERWSPLLARHSPPARPLANHSLLLFRSCSCCAS